MPMTKAEEFSTGRYKKAVDTLVATLKPRDHDNTSTMFDVGYEQCKRDILKRIEKTLET